LVGFLDDDPIAYRKVGLSKTFLDSKEKSKELVKTTLTDSRHVKFVGKNDEKVSLRLDLYAGKYDESTIDDITETPFERYFLASMGVFDPDQTEIKFQGKIYTVAQLNKYFKEMNYSVSGSGSVFEKTGKDGKQGLIPSYLEYMFVERKIQKKAAFGHFKNKNTLQRFRKAAIADGLYTEVKK
jgi:hypothetical protein